MAYLIETLVAGVITNTGTAAAGGSAYIYQVGTTTKVTAYQDSDLAVPHANPVVLDSNGKAEVYVNQAVRLVIQDSSGTQISDIDSVGGSVASSASSTTVVSDQLVPIGSIIPFYDFDGALSFDTDYWVYCDGQAQTIGGASRTTPDLSNRYLVGFGTEGGGDIDSAVWATAAVGQASHTSASIAHTHTGPSHTHAIPGLGYNATSNELGITESLLDLGSDIGTVDEHWNATDGNDTGYLRFTTTSGGTGATGSALTTISIQPRSVRVRFIMRAQ